MNKKRVLGLFIFALVFSSLIFGVVSAVTRASIPADSVDGGDTVSTFASSAGDNIYNEIKTFLKKPGINVLSGLFLGLWGEENFTYIENSIVGPNISSLIIYFVSIVIFFFIFKGLFDFASPFGEGINWIIGVGILIIALQLKFIFVVTRLATTAFAILGAVGVWLELLILGALMIGAVLGAQWAAQFAHRRRLAKQGMKEEAGAEEVKEFVKTAKTVAREVRRDEHS